LLHTLLFYSYVCLRTTKAYKILALHTTYVIVTNHTGANTRPWSKMLEPNVTKLCTRKRKTSQIITEKCES
jgi:hypothetical protein